MARWPITGDMGRVSQHVEMKWSLPDMGPLGEQVFIELLPKLEGVEYMFGFGTALALYRDGRINQTDSDIDINILTGQEPAIRQALADWPIGYERYEHALIRIDGGPSQQIIWYPHKIIVDVDVWTENDGYEYGRFRMPSFNIEYHDTIYGPVPLPADTEITADGIVWGLADPRLPWQTTMRILTFGAFDLCHYGHIRLLKRCAQLGEVHVGLGTDSQVAGYKQKPILNYEQRAAHLRELPWVTEVHRRDDDDVKPIVNETLPDLLAVGSDWSRTTYLQAIRIGEEYLARYEIGIVFLPYTDTISTSMIRKLV